MDRLKLYQGYEFVENVPLQKGAPKREFWRDLASTKDFILEADLKAGSEGWGRELSRHRKDTRSRRQDILYKSESDAFLSMVSIIRLSWKSIRSSIHPPSFRSFSVLYIFNGE